jgi:O-antigen/teichoic acid export membrane protein
MNLAARIRSDELLGRVVRNSAHLFSSNAAGLGLSVLQGILAARMLGPAGFGLIGIVMSYASTVNGMLSFRMGELVVRYGGAYLEKEDKRRAAALIKVAASAEAAVSLIAFLAVALTAGVAARFAAKSPGIEWMFVIYSLGLLCNFNAETATGVLQITNKIKTRGTINFIQALLSAAIIVGVFIWDAKTGVDAQTGLLLVLVAYLLGKAILGLGLFIAGMVELNRVLGPGWVRQSASASTLPSLPELFRFALSSNLSATAILVFRESEVLWVGILLNSEAAGLYKVAYTIVSLLSVPADPLILSVYPEANRLVVHKAWERLKDFLKKVTTLSFLYNMGLALGFVVLGRWMLSIFGAQYTAAFPAMMALLAGLAFNYTLFWNRPLLLSLGLQTFALGAVVFAGILKVALAIPLVPRYGYAMEAVLLSAYYVISVGLIAWRGLRELNMRLASAQEQQPGPR